MFGQNYYFSLIRKYVTLFGTLFDDISISRTDAGGNVTEVIKVPITYAPKDKMLARVLQDPNIDKQSATLTLPMLSFEMGQMHYAADRKLKTIGRVSVKKDASNFSSQYNPVPYDFNFKLYIYVKNTEDGTKIIEQILPYFTPDWTTSVKLIPEMEETRDIPTVLNNISYEDNYASGDMTTRRAIIWTLDFTIKGYLYGPSNSAGIIKFISLPFMVSDAPDGQIVTITGNTAASDVVSVQPGLSSNNTPINYYGIYGANTGSIPYTSIEATDDYGFITEIQSSTDSK